MTKSIKNVNVRSKSVLTVIFTRASHNRRRQGNIWRTFDEDTEDEEIINFRRNLTDDDRGTGDDPALQSPA